MNEPDDIERFNRQIDEILAGTFPSNSRQRADEYRLRLEIAQHLSEADFSASSQQKFLLEERLRQMAAGQLPRQNRWRRLQMGVAKTTRLLAWGGACVLLVAVISWAYLRLLPAQPLPTATQLSVQTTPILNQPAQIPTAVRTTRPILSQPLPTTVPQTDETPLAQASPQPSPTPGQVPLKALTSSSSFNTVRARLERSWALWNTLWVEARISTTQDGKTSVEREQVWIQQPENGLWLSGPANGNPTKARIQSNGQTVQVNLENHNRKELGNASLVPSLLYKMLLPSWPLALQDGTYQVTGEETVAGRRAIVVQYTNIEGQKADRLWVDAEKGVILRWENVAVSSAGSHVKISQEIEITRIVFNTSFPQGLFDLNGSPPKNFANQPVP